MEPKPFWRGYLKLSLVTCPVALTPASGQAEKVRFHTLNRKTGDRVVSRYVDAVTGEPVEDDDQVKGYARGENDFVVLEDDELEAVGLESVRTIDIESFAPLDAIDWIWREDPYYVTPDDPVGVEAYCVIRDAMRAEGMAAISRLVLRRREHAVMLQARDNGIVLWTLRYGEDARDPSDYFNDRTGDRDLDPELNTLVVKLIEERKKRWSPSLVQDPVQSRLLEFIEEKKKGMRKRPPEKARPEPTPTNVVNIMDALRRSVAEGRRKAPKK